MNPLTEKQLRACFVNATRREITQATLPDLTVVAWDHLDYLGWRDRRMPLSAYVVVEVDGAPTGILLRGTDPAPDRSRRSSVCAWCTDLIETDVTLYVTRRAGAAGRQGNTIGTLICSDFLCSRNVRRPPTHAEAGMDAEGLREQIVGRRIAELRERSTRFVVDVLSTR